MDAMHVERLARALADGASRRQTIVSALIGGVALIRGGDVASAKKKRKRKHKHKKRTPTARPNEFGCFEVGDPCSSEDDCCSGVCADKKGKKSCRAHGTGVCDQKAPGLCQEPDLALAFCDADCACLRTTAGSRICGQVYDPYLEDQCADCQKDADCLALGFSAGSACIPVATGNCAGQCENGMACVVPCGAALPG